jgi:hypothetical protein
MTISSDLPLSTAPASALDAPPVRRAPQVNYVLFTNGDNLFNVDVLPVVAPSFQHGIDIIAYSFTSHYNRGGVVNDVVRTKFEFNHIDLSAVMYRRGFLQEARREGQGRFMPKGDGTPHKERRDWEFTHELLQRPGVTTHLEEGVLLFHQ